MSITSKKNCILPKKIQNKHGKLYLNLYQKFDRKLYTSLEAFTILTENLKGKKQSVDVVFVLDIDPKKSDQVTKGVLKVVPNGLGKDVKIAVFTKTKADECLENEATYAGFETLVADIKAETIDADVYIATAEIMPELAKLGIGRLLKGKMPNPKLGTVVLDKELLQAIKEQKAGQLSFRSQGKLIQCRIGQTSFTPKALNENYLALKEVIEAERPQSVKPQTYIKKVFISSTMSPSFQISIHTNEEQKK